MAALDLEGPLPRLLQPVTWARWTHSTRFLPISNVQFNHTALQTRCTYANKNYLFKHCNLLRPIDRLQGYRLAQQGGQ